MGNLESINSLRTLEKNLREKSLRKKTENILSRVAVCTTAAGIVGAAHQLVGKVPPPPEQRRLGANTTGGIANHGNHTVC